MTAYQNILSYLKSLLNNPVFSLILMALLTAILYSNTLNAGFIFDDYQYILEDPAVRMAEFTTENLSHAALNGKPRHRLLPNMSFAVNYYFGGYNVVGYHLVNIVLHFLTGVFLFFFIRITLGIDIRQKSSKIYTEQGFINSVNSIALFASCLWLVHPLQTQAVTYIVQRMTSMAVMFYILSLLLYILGRLSWQNNQHRLKAGGFFAGCIISGGLALASKQNAATLPFVILLYEWFFFQDLKIKWSKKQILWIFSILMIFGILALIYLGENPVERILRGYALRDYSFSQRILTQLRVIPYYITLLFFTHPGRLALDYDYPLSNGLLHPATTLLSLVAIVALISLAVYLGRKKSRLASFCILWFFVTLLIESSVISIEIVYEHRMYLASMMPALLLSFLVISRTRPHWLAICLLSIILLISATWTYQRNITWQEPLAFWEDNLKKTPNDHRVLNNMGFSLMQAGHYDQAIPYLQKSIQLKTSAQTIRTTLLDPLRNLGAALIQIKKFDRAIETLQTAIKIDPESAPSHVNLATAYEELEQHKKAITHYKKALEIQPQSIRALTGLADIYLKQGTVQRAARYLQKAHAIDDKSVKIKTKLARCFVKTGQPEKAIDLYQSALSIAPANEALLINLGNTYAAKKNLSEAVKYYKKALRLNPRNASARFNLAVACSAQKEYEKAIQIFREMLNYLPNNPNIYYNIACMHSLNGHPSKSAEWLKKALAKGYDSWKKIKTDPDLANLRQSKYYQELIATKKSQISNNK